MTTNSERNPATYNRPAILIVDDRKANLAALRTVLADVDAEVIEATSGNAALTATLDREFALAILDVQMPGMDGYELAGLLRGNARTRTLPIIFITATHPDEACVFKGYEAGAVDYIVKPYNPVVLLAKVRVFLELNAKTTELAAKVEALAASEERFRILVMTVPDIVFRVDPEGRFTFLNEAVNCLGYAPQDLLHRHFSEVMLPADVDNCARGTVLPRFAGKETGPEGAPRLFDERRTGQRLTTGLEVRLIPRHGKPSIPAVVLSTAEECAVVEVSSSGLYAVAPENGRRVFLGTVGVIRDITERKRTEEELRKHRDHLEELVYERTAELKESKEQLARNLTDMTRLRDLGALFVRDDDMESVLNEIADTAIAITNADFGTIQLFDPATGDLRIVAHRGFKEDYLDFWNSTVKGEGCCGTALKSGERVIVEDVEKSPIFVGTPALEVQQKAGVRAVQSTPLVSRSGEIIGMFSTHYRTPQRPGDRMLHLLDLLARQAADIIERAKIEKTLRQRSAELQLIIDSTDSALTHCSRDLRYLSANPAYSRYIELPLEQVIGKPILEVMGEAAFKGIMPYVERVLCGERVEFEAELPIAGHSKYIRAVYVPDRDSSGDVVGWFASVSDITMRKRAEQVLCESEARLKKVLEVETVGVMFWDLTSGCMTDANDTFLKMMGYSRADVEERSLTWQKLTPPEYVEASLQEIEKFRETGRVGPYEKEYLRKDGSRV